LKAKKQQDFHNNLSQKTSYIPKNRRKQINADAVKRLISKVEEIHNRKLGILTNSEKS